MLEVTHVQDLGPPEVNQEESGNVVLDDGVSLAAQGATYSGRLDRRKNGSLLRLAADLRPPP